MRTFYIENFGCRATQADGAALDSLFHSNGLRPSPRESANIIVFNTCTVTATVDSDVRASIRKTHRENPTAQLLVTGCYAQRAPLELSLLPGVSWVVGNSHKHEIAEIVSQTPYHDSIHHSDQFEGVGVLPSAPLPGHARPNLKIQDGCNNRCAFCIIPSVRGHSRYLPADQVVERVRALSSDHPEIVLTGINLGRWGREAGHPARLHDLLNRILADTSVARLRLSSVEPMDWTDELIDLVARHPRLARHAHVPLQSGSDAILRRMHRKYRPRHYAGRIAKLAAAMPDGAIGADVMTGFPGETADLFAESLAFIEDMPFAYLHVFTYSERSGTKAASLDGAVPMEQRRDRTAILRSLSDRRNLEFRRRMSGRTLSAVTLETSPNAITSNNIRVELAHWPGPRQLVDVEVAGLSGTGMRERGTFALFSPSN